MTTLSKGDQENLNYILKKDTKKIMESFTNLSNRTCDSLIRQEVTVDRLVRVAVTSNSSLHDKLTGSTSIDQVFTHLAPEISFFNHKTLAKIIEELGHPDDKDRLDDYSKEFKEFCKRKIFEVEPGHCTCGQRFSQLKQRKLFAVVLPAGEEMLQNLGDAVSIKEMLADDLDIPLDTLHLHRIDRGSIILVFSVPDSIACDLFPLPKEKLALLTKKGIVLFVPQDMKSETNQVDLDKFINEISKHIGMQWMFLARSLGFEQTDIDAIEYRDQRNLREQIFQMFHEWKRREGSEATTDSLLAAVKDAELKELMKTLKEKGFIVSLSRGTYMYNNNILLLSCMYIIM